MDDFVAHARKSDNKKQYLKEHLLGVAEHCSTNASKIGLKNVGFALGLLHDLGKYSDEFQSYIHSATGLLDPDADDFVDAEKIKGRVDHSSAGAQYLWNSLKNIGNTGQGKLVGQILAICIASHHSGIINVIAEDGTPVFANRMAKDNQKTNTAECIEKFKHDFRGFENIPDSKDLVQEMLSVLKRMNVLPKKSMEDFSIENAFSIGMLLKFLFSCLIDSDRLDSAEFEEPARKEYRLNKESWYNWSNAVEQFEMKIKSLPQKNPINHIRREISDNCKKRAAEATGIFSLTVPTGGGKTFSSLRFALYHALQHDLDRIFFIIPYTSIVEQNSEEVRKILQLPNDEFEWVLEHHSNIEPEKETWHMKLVAENWDVPIVFTTMVQFLETLFGSGTRGIRRMHQLSKSVMIFDEIQTLPIKCVHMFCNSINFFTQHAGSTAVMCTATQPLLDSLRNSELGQLKMSKNSELVPNTNSLFDSLKRIHISDATKIGGWKDAEIADLAIKNMVQKGSCLVIVNTKEWAQKLFTICKGSVDENKIFHLSTNQYPAHRKKILDSIRKRLDDKLPVLCISTQLIEAGVDIDFSSVIRFIAGLDSIAQAGGRCNRNGRLQDDSGNCCLGRVQVINPDDEKISILTDIKIGQEKTRRILSEFEDSELLEPEAMKQYFDYYFYERSNEMTYPVSGQRNDNLINILSINKHNINTFGGISKDRLPLLRQSFMDAGKWFKSIDAPTKSLIVQHGKGVEIVAELCGVAKYFDAAKYYKLLKESQQYSVNVFPNIWRKLIENEAIFEIQKGEGVYYLKKEFYDEKFGLSTKQASSMDLLLVEEKNEK